MKQEYKRIRKELFAHSPRFKKRQAVIYLWFFLRLGLAEALVGAFVAGVWLLSPIGSLFIAVVGVAVFWTMLKSSILCKKALYGTVIEIGRDNLMVNSQTNIRRMESKNFTVYTVARPDGKNETLLLPVPYERVFKKGDKLIRLSGMKYPVDLTPEELLICPFCGNIFPTENEICIGCGEPALNAKAIEEIKEHE